MENKFSRLLALALAASGVLLMLGTFHVATAQSGWPPLDSNCTDGECVFGVSLSSDDAGPKPECNNFATAWPEIYFGRCTNGGFIFSGFRFTNVTLTPSVGITQAYLVFMVDGFYSTPITLTINGENSTNAQTFSSSSQPEFRSRLSGVSIPWSIPSSDAWVSGNVRQSPNIAPIIQAIVDKPGWQSGNALAILIDPSSTTATGAYRRVFAYDRLGGGVSVSARLVIRTGPRKTFLPVVGKNFPVPLAAPSYYIENVSTIKDKGAILGNQAHNTPGTQDYLVILVYGYPGRNNATGEYGAFYTFSANVFISQTAIIDSASAFALDFYRALGSDTTSKLRLVIGVNNCCDGVSLSIFQNHGTAWGNVVNSIKANINACCSSQVSVVAGLDAEREWVPGIVMRPYRTTQWLDWYMSSSNCDPVASGDDGCMYNYGTMDISASGDTCATSDSQTVWTGCDVWYISWGALKNGKRFPRALPEIYHVASSQPPYGTDATAWQSLSAYSIDRKAAGPIWFVGSLTQFARCGPICDDGYSQYGNNTPEQGWGLLMDALGSDSRTAQIVRWSTDIRKETQP